MCVTRPCARLQRESKRSSVVCIFRVAICLPVPGLLAHDKYEFGRACILLRHDTERHSIKHMCNTHDVCTHPSVRNSMRVALQVPWETVDTSREHGVPSVRDKAHKGKSTNEWCTEHAYPLRLVFCPDPLSGCDCPCCACACRYRSETKTYAMNPECPRPIVAIMDMNVRIDVAMNVALMLYGHMCTILTLTNAELDCTRWPWDVLNPLLSSHGSADRCMSWSDRRACQVKQLYDTHLEDLLSADLEVAKVIVASAVVTAKQSEDTLVRLMSTGYVCRALYRASDVKLCAYDMLAEFVHCLYGGDSARRRLRAPPRGERCDNETRRTEHLPWECESTRLCDYDVSHVDVETGEVEFVSFKQGCPDVCSFRMKFDNSKKSTSLVGSGSYKQVHVLSPTTAEFPSNTLAPLSDDAERHPPTKKQKRSECTDNALRHINTRDKIPYVAALPVFFDDEARMEFDASAITKDELRVHAHFDKSGISVPLVATSSAHCNCPAVVMPLMKNVDDTVRRSTTSQPDRVSEYAWQMYDAFCIMLEHNFIHTDMCSKQIVLDYRTNELKVCDFGNGSNLSEPFVDVNLWKTTLTSKPPIVVYFFSQVVIKLFSLPGSGKPSYAEHAAMTRKQLHDLINELVTSD